MKTSKISIVILLLTVGVFSSCNKEEEFFMFQFATNPYNYAMEKMGGIQTFGFLSPHSWTITWDPVDWMHVDPCQLSGEASQNARDWHIIVMNIDIESKDKNQTVEFMVKEGGEIPRNKNRTRIDCVYYIIIA